MVPGTTADGGVGSPRASTGVLGDVVLVVGEEIGVATGGDTGAPCGVAVDVPTLGVGADTACVSVATGAVVVVPAGVAIVVPTPVGAD